MCFLVAITRRSMIKIRGGSRLVGGGSQSGLVICRSTYEPGGGGRGDTCVVLLTERLILASC